MKKSISLLLIAVMTLGLLSACAGAEDGGESAEPIIVKFSHDLQQGTPQDIGAAEFKRIVEEQTDGRYEIQIFPSGQLGTDIESAEMMQTNTIQAGLVPTAKLSGFSPTVQLIDLPFLFPTREITYEVLDSEIIDEMFAPLEDSNLIGTAVWESGFKQMTANKEIRKPQDFEGLKVRVMESPLLIEQYSTLGANPVPIDFAEVYNALQQNVVDAQENPLVSITKMRFYEVQSHMMLSNHGYLGYAFLFSKGFWESMSEEDQAIFKAASREAATLEREETVSQEEGFLEEIRESGTTIVEWTPEEMEAFSEAMKPVHAHFAESIGEELLEKTYDMIESLQ